MYKAEGFEAWLRRPNLETRQHFHELLDQLRLDVNRWRTRALSLPTVDRALVGFLRLSASRRASLTVIHPSSADYPYGPLVAEGTILCRARGRLLLFLTNDRFSVRSSYSLLWTEFGRMRDRIPSASPGRTGVASYIQNQSGTRTAALILSPNALLALQDSQPVFDRGGCARIATLDPNVEEHAYREI